MEMDKQKKISELTEEEVDKALLEKYGENWNRDLAKLVKANPSDELIKEFFKRAAIAF